MGIRGLQTFLQWHCKDEACYEVNIPELISDYLSENGHEPEIVVDAQSCFQMWYDGLDWTIGMEVQKLIDRLRSFVETFEEMGAKLVFFIGGFTPDPKRRTWLLRRRACIRKMRNVFDMYYAGRLFEDIPTSLNHIPPNMGNFVTYVLKYYLDCKVYVTIDECDVEIIRYVHKNDSFAIFSDDTDFVISEVDCVVLCARSFDSGELTTLRYDRHALCKSLNIRDDRLRLLAILAGNDLVSYKSVRPFHIRLCKWSPQKHIPYKILMRALGKYIRGLRWAKSMNELLRSVCYDVFGDSSKANAMRVAINAYAISEEPDYLPHNVIWNRILNAAEDRVRNILLPPSVWGILKENMYESSVCFEDFRKINDDNETFNEMPSATVTRPLRKRLYGVLLFENRKSNPTITEWCAENTFSYETPKEVAPVYPTDSHPGLRALWDSDRDHIHNERKWTLFLHSVSPNIDNVDSWTSLPLDLVVPTAACYYLFREESIVSKWEVWAILATIVRYSSYDCDDLEELDIGTRHNFRAIQINVTFLRTCSLIFTLLASCGYPVPLSEDTCFVKFESKLFQMKYRQVKNKVTPQKICDYDPDSLDLYNQLRDTINGH